ncbi:aldehyde dehydrogenase (NAD+) [Nonlabens sp. Hel1_33_55]|uniref:aldehyde dehydrogenase family protein n=1 Tax=Nonlabens sp. Hel1_33_55 TaxID=1336802 RepID=UPI000875BCF9|nr:aldehyde dehydrogenase family protein [Nonlabens sp. Hel1_33_55]SCY07015.1 aldehyde dehydrogenase (NAD+) [Nonlabens sp. Hel1_33_55]
MDFSKNLNKQYINGSWVDGRDDDVIINKNPYNQEKLQEIKAASKADVDKAYKAAKEASTSWANALPQERSQVVMKFSEALEKNKEKIMEWLIKEAGSTKVKAQIEIQICQAIIKEAASFPTRSHGFIMHSSIPGKENRVYRRPIGVMGIISPWNFPLNLSIRSVVTAIALGNTLVLKPASQTPVTGAILIAKLFEEAGLPKGVCNVVVGKGSEIGDYFVAHETPQLISFTGSTPVGRNIGKIAGEALKKVALELGGNNVFIVMKDADVDNAVDAALFGKFMHQGQICMSINRIVLQEDIADEFVEKFVEKAKKLKAGDPSDKKTTIGPLIDTDQVERIQEDVKKSVEAGAKLVLDGKVESTLMHPTILDHVTDDMPIAANEIFGPVAAIIRFKTEEDALKIANSKDFGLSGALHTKNIEKAVAFARKVETGMIHINDQTVNDEPNVPFGGEKGSGVGRFNGEFILEEFTRLQWVSIQHEDRDYAPFA